ncbi:transmembrane protein 267-like [Glandiceps talaboti]
MLAWKQATGCALLGCVCVIADLSLHTSWIRSNTVLRVFIDNSAHGLLAFLCWGIATQLRTTDDVFHAILCGILSCGLDIDHFIASGSLSLKAALSLDSRPLFHCTTLIPVIAVLLKLANVLRPMPHLKPLPWIFTVAWLTHHIRDGFRRGLWLWPFGNTDPLPYWLYLIATMMSPVVTMVTLQVTNSRKFRMMTSIEQL